MIDSVGRSTRGYCADALAACYLAEIELAIQSVKRPAIVDNQGCRNRRQPKPMHGRTWSASDLYRWRYRNHRFWNAPLNEQSPSVRS